jgi:hypothetical protein
VSVWVSGFLSGRACSSDGESPVVALEGKNLAVSSVGVVGGGGDCGLDIVTLLSGLAASSQLAAAVGLLLTSWQVASTPLGDLWCERHGPWICGAPKSLQHSLLPRSFATGLRILRRSEPSCRGKI